MSECPCCLPPWELGEEKAFGDTSDCDATKFHMYVGRITSTIATSIAHGMTGTTTGMSWDGQDTYSINRASGTGDPQDLRRYSGQFTTTIRSSVNVYDANRTAADLAWDGANTLWVDEYNSGGQVPTLYVQSGRFSSTIKSSVDVTGPHDSISEDGTNTLSSGDDSGITTLFKMYRYSGKVTSTIKTSISIGTGGVSSPARTGMAYDGSDVFKSVDYYNTDIFARRLHAAVYSGLFSSTVVASQDFVGDNGLNTNIRNTG